MFDSYYLPAKPSAETAVGFRSGPHTVGPWAAHLQHGGPPNALAVTVAERTVRAAGRDDLIALRLAADFVGPVPVGDLDVTARVVRAARSAVLVETVVAAGGRDCLLVRVWFVRRADTAALAPALAPAAALPTPFDPSEPSDPSDPSGADEVGLRFGYGDSVEWRFLGNGRMTVPGPAAAWARPRVPLLPDEPMSGLARAALIADSAGGISAELSWTEWSFANVDLDVHLARPLLGEWVLLDATTQLGPAGSALARSTLSDTAGIVGAGLQTLVLSELPARAGPSVRPSEPGATGPACGTLGA